MSVDKVLHKIQSQINELAPTLELFVEETIQPTADDCENLQKQLTHLQESLAVYKFQKQNKELSPSFNIHAKVSEVEIPSQKVDLKQEEYREPEVVTGIKTEVKEAVMDSLKTEIPLSSKSVSIGINDKFRFINELFSRNTSEYNIALEQLNSVGSWHEAEVYLNSLKSLYQWRESDEVAKLFYNLVKKRFD